MPRNDLASHWPVGTKVSVQERTGDFYSPSRQVSTAKVGKDGLTVEAPEGRYWAVAEIDAGVQAVSFTSKTSPTPRKRTPAPTKADLSTHPAVLPGAEIITGPRGTKVAGRVTEEPIQRGVEPHPHLNQASIGDKVPQRSSTPLGQATPTDPEEPQPKPTQEQVKKGTPQRSDTETGEATPISEDAGTGRQEDVGRRVQQRSSTETGEATPIGLAEPRGTSSNPDSREQAAGVRPTDEKVSKTPKPDAAKKLKKS